MPEFQNPAAFLLLLLVPLLFLLRYLKIFKKVTFDAVLSDWNGKEFKWNGKLRSFVSTVSKIILFVAFCLVVIALSDPVITYQEKVYTTLGTDIVFVVDTSPSMAAKDIAGMQRIEAAKKCIHSLAQVNEGFQLGLVEMAKDTALVVPLTMDYDYVIEQLELAKRAFKKSSDLSRRKKDFSRDIDPELYSFKYDGTLAVGGSSYIGDGLYSSLTHFGELKGNTRSKIIILATDNWVNGSPNITIEEATEYCKRNNVKVYGIAPKEVVEEEQFKKGVESTGGKYYHVEDTGAVKDIISEIEKTQKSDLSIPQTLITDYPKVPFFCLIVFMGIYFWISKRIRL